MRTITLYKYERADGGMTVSPKAPEGEYTEMFRIIADEGKVLTKDGETFLSCADVASVEGWQEITDPEAQASEADYQSALEDLGVTFNEDESIE